MWRHCCCRSRSDLLMSVCVQLHGLCAVDDLRLLHPVLTSTPDRSLKPSTSTARDQWYLHCSQYVKPPPCFPLGSTGDGELILLQCVQGLLRDQRRHEGAVDAGPPNPDPSEGQEPGAGW